MQLWLYEHSSRQQCWALTPTGTTSKQIMNSDTVFILFKNGHLVLISVWNCSWKIAGNLQTSTPSARLAGTRLEPLWGTHWRSLCQPRALTTTVGKGCLPCHPGHPLGQALSQPPRQLKHQLRSQVFIFGKEWGTEGTQPGLELPDLLRAVSISHTGF